MPKTPATRAQNVIIFSKNLSKSVLLYLLSRFWVCRASTSPLLETKLQNEARCSSHVNPMLWKVFPRSLGFDGFLDPLTGIQVWGPAEASHTVGISFCVCSLGILEAWTLETSHLLLLLWKSLEWRMKIWCLLSSEQWPRSDCPGWLQKSAHSRTRLLKLSGQIIFISAMTESSSISTELNPQGPAAHWALRPLLSPEELKELKNCDVWRGEMLFSWWQLSGSS